MGKLLKNISYTITSNFLNFVVIALITFIVPKLIGVRDFGYWQLYLFYTTYVGVFHLGWIDGIYLRYGGMRYQNLDKGYFKTQFILFSLLQILAAIAVCCVSYFFVQDFNSRLVLYGTGGYLVFSNLRQFFLYILQDTNRIKDYAKILIYDRIIFVMLILTLLLMGVRNFQILIVSDLIGKSLTLGVGIFICRDIVTTKLLRESYVLRDVKVNISVGSKLLLANFAGVLIIGIVRYGIKYEWGVKIFGKISLTLSISNAMMIFITAISLVLFPMLRRVSKDKLVGIYSNFRVVLVFFLLLCLFFYYPLIKVMNMWLPEYVDALRYLAFLFPILVYEGKFELLVNTFMKTMRMERTLFLTNILALAISFVITILNLFIIKDLDFMMFSIVIILFFRSNLGELILSTKLNTNVINHLISETVMVCIFIYASYKLEYGMSILVYLVSFAIYVMRNINMIKNSLQELKAII